MRVISLLLCATAAIAASRSDNKNTATEVEQPIIVAPAISTNGGISQITMRKITKTSNLRHEPRSLADEPTPFVDEPTSRVDAVPVFKEVPPADVPTPLSPAAGVSKSTVGSIAPSSEPSAKTITPTRRPTNTKNPTSSPSVVTENPTVNERQPHKTIMVDVPPEYQPINDSPTQEPSKVAIVNALTSPTSGTAEPSVEPTLIPTRRPSSTKRPSSSPSIETAGPTDDMVNIYPHGPVKISWPPNIQLFDTDTPTYQPNTMSSSVSLGAPTPTAAGQLLDGTTDTPIRRLTQTKRPTSSPTEVTESPTETARQPHTTIRVDVPPEYQLPYLGDAPTHEPTALYTTNSLGEPSSFAVDPPTDNAPTRRPTITTRPSSVPTIETESPSGYPSEPIRTSSSPVYLPTTMPTSAPTETPTRTPTETPTRTPTETPTRTPTQTPTRTPTQAPTPVPTSMLSVPPTRVPTRAPTMKPSSVKTESPTNSLITLKPTVVPVKVSTKRPSRPTRKPTTTKRPSAAPSSTVTRVSPTDSRYPQGPFRVTLTPNIDVPSIINGKV